MFTIRYLRSVDGCTCGGTASDIMSMHEPLCGWDPAPDPHELCAEVERERDAALAEVERLREERDKALAQDRADMYVMGGIAEACDEARARLAAMTAKCDDVKRAWMRETAHEPGSDAEAHYDAEVQWGAAEAERLFPRGGER